MQEDTARSGGRFDSLIAILLGLAAVLAATTSYQGALRGGDSIKSFNEGIRSINDANGYFNEATQSVARDQSLFLEYAKAAQEDNPDLAEYLKTAIMDENLSKAVDEWQNDKTDEIATPLDAPSYEVPAQVEGERLTKLTDRQFDQARALDDEGDRFDLVGVIVATALFFLGIAGVLGGARIRMAGLSLGTITLIVAAGLWITN